MDFATVTWFSVRIFHFVQNSSISQPSLNLLKKSKCRSDLSVTTDNVHNEDAFVSVK